MSNILHDDLSQGITPATSVATGAPGAPGETGETGATTDVEAQKVASKLYEAEHPAVDLAYLSDLNKFFISADVARSKCGVLLPSFGALASLNPEKLLFKEHVDFVHKSRTYRSKWSCCTHYNKFGKHVMLKVSIPFDLNIQFADPSSRAGYTANLEPYYQLADNVVVKHLLAPTLFAAKWMAKRKSTSFKMSADCKHVVLDFFCKLNCNTTTVGLTIQFKSSFGVPVALTPPRFRFNPHKS